MGIVRVTFIHPGRLTSAPSAIKKLWAVKWPHSDTVFFMSVLYVADKVIFF